VVIDDGVNLRSLDVGKLKASGQLAELEKFARATEKSGELSGDGVIVNPPRVEVDPSVFGGDEIVTFLPSGLARVRRADGSFAIADRFGREASYVYDRLGNLVGYKVNDGNLTVFRGTDNDGHVTSSEIFINNNLVGVEFSQAGSILGAQLGYRLADGNELTGIVYSAALQTIGNNIGDFLDGVINGQPVTRSLDDAFAAIGREFITNLKSAGIGALSSFLTAELVKALGLDGFAGDLASSAAGTYMSAIIQALPELIKGTASLGNVLGNVNVGNVIGGFLGSTLASQIVHFETVGGQIGSAVGAAVGSIVALSESVGLASTLATAFGQLGFLGGPVAAAIGAFVGFIIGGLIGSLFGGTPRSGADAQWDATQGKFVVANVWSKKGGSKDAAKSLASAAAETFNGVLAAAGGTLLNPEAVQAGNYGMRKSDFVYQTAASQDQNNITFRISSKAKDSFGRVLGYGVVQALTDPDFQIAGGDVYVKRAIYRTFEMGGIDATNFDTNTLFGNISSAQQYESYLANAGVINALVSAESDSAFAAETLITLARADELGLTRRHRSDWFGGFSFLLKEADTNAANVDFGFDYDPASSQVSRLIGVGNYVLGDAIDIAGQTTIEGTPTAETIDLRTGSLANQIGYTVNGHLNNDIAVSGSDFTAVATPVTFAANARRATVSVNVANDGIAEATENFITSLSNAPTMRIMGGDAVATVVNGAAALPTLMVGDSYAWESDGYAVFRLSLSKAAGTAITVALALTDGRAAGLGVDFGSSGAGNLQVSTDGVTWANASSATFAAGVKELFVRTAVVADNVPNPAYVVGGTQPQFLNVEGNERFTLSATVTTGAAALANGTQAVFGTGTIVDGAGNEPLVWVDNVVVDEATGVGSFVLSRSSTLATAATVDFATSDRRVLNIDIAATVDGGDGNDTIFASNLGDNLFGGTGNDTLYGGRLDDWLLGGDGDDVLDAGTQDQGQLGGDGNYLNGGAGNDTLKGREGSDWLEGGEGTDIITGGAGDDILAGGAGDNDDLKGGIGADQYLVRLGDGLDIAEDDATGAPVANGVGDAITQRMNAIQLWKSNPATAGAVRPDWVGNAAGVQQNAVAGGEDSVVFGVGIAMGDVRLVRSGTSGAPGNDLIIQIMQTVNGTETFTGTQLSIKDWFSNPFKRVEWLRFADGNEIRIGDITSFVVGGSGNDVLIGTSGNDFVYGGAGNDKLYLLAGDDVGNGGTGDDMVAGDSGRDLLIGGLGNDELIGGAGSDAITGDAGADDIYGGADRDTLSGGRGDGDMVVGGAGDDTFRYARGDGKDTYFDEFANYWEVVWTSAGQWNAAAGYAYNGTTGEVTGPGGIVIRKNLGTVAEPDFQWLGRYDYDSVTQTLKFFNPPTGVTVTANAGVDTIEFAPGINLQDVILRRPAGSNDLVLAVSSEDEELADTSLAKDSVTIKDWYLAPGQIEKLAFYQTGIFEIDSASRTLVAGTDASDGTIATPLQGTAGADWITGAAGDDVIAGGTGNDILAGNSGFDTLKGEAGDDVLYGGTGNDTLDGGAGKDVLVGGAGQDAASYASAAAAARVQLSARWANAGDADGDEYYGIEDITGGSGADVLGGDAGQNEITGGAGNDTLQGNAGDDTYVWNVGNGADTIQDGSFVVQEAVTAAGALAPGYVVSIWAATGTKSGANFYWRLQITLGAGGPIVYDSSAFLYAAATGVAQPLPSAYVQAGWLGGFARTNGQQVTRQLFDAAANGGSDELEFGPNISLNDLTFIKSGNDLIVRYGGLATSQVTIKDQLLTGSAVETLKFADGLSVSLTSVLVAASSTQLVGTVGDDLIAGQAGALVDSLSGGDGSDTLVGYAGDDTLLGGNGDDVLEGGLGADTLNGEAHVIPTSGPTVGDTARYVRSAAAVTVDLNLATAQGGAVGSDSVGDILSGIENVTGSIYADTLTGNSADNRLFGLDGNDTLRGGAGSDVLTGDAGNDFLYGDAGEDSIAGGDGNDTLYGGTEKDVLDGGDGVDILYGEAGADTLTGGAGADTLDGGADDDVLSGNSENDTLTGGLGNDILSGGLGNDILNGGIGNDRYVLERYTGSDTINDLDGTNAVQFDSSVSYDKVWMTRVGNDLRIAVIGGDTVTTVTGFFLASGGSKIRTIETTTHAIFLDHPDTLNLITAMTAATATPAVTPVAMPTGVSSLLPTYWHAGGKAAPTGPTAARQVSLAEDGNIVINGAYGVIDHDQNVTGYSLKAGFGPALGTISDFNAATGALTYTANADANGSDSFVVLATDADGQAVELTVAVTIAAVNDAPRGLASLGGAALSVVEAAPGQNIVAGTVIGQFTATDPEGDVITYSLSDTAGGRFSISSDGKLSVAAPGSIDFELAQSHTIKVRAIDSAGAWSEQDFVVSVQNGNDANSLPSSYALAVNENVALGTVVGAVAATDVDQTGPFASQRYYFLNGTTTGATSSDGRYAINATTGQITVAAALNFEAGTPSKVYQVIARDNAGVAPYNQAQSAVTIGINDLNEANSVPATHAFTVNENVALGTVVGVVAASDVDSAGSIGAQQRYYFWNGTAASATSADGRYAINATTGQITVAAALNFEAGTTSVTYQVIARDNAGGAGYNQVQSAVTIGINNLNEANSLPSSYALAVNENVALGTVVGAVAATDIDLTAPFASQRYYFWNGTTTSATSSDGRYAISSTTGQITVAAALNFEAGTPSVIYQVIARDNAGAAPYNQAQSAVTIGINDLNEAPTSLNWTPLVASVAERDKVAAGTVKPAIALGSISVTDPDTAGLPNATYNYSVSDPRFEIVSGTLRLKQDASLNYEAGATVTIVVTGTDQTGTPFTINKTILITVTDQDDIFEGTIGNDTIAGQSGRDIISAYAGNDTVFAGTGNDSVDGGDGNDTLYGEDGNDTVLGQAGADTLYGGLGADTLRGGTENDILSGDDGNDALYGEDGDEGVRATGTESWRGFTQAGLLGGIGDDILNGGAGNDYLDGGAGADQLVGGLGFDGADYSASTAAVTINLATGTGIGGFAQGDTLSEIELLNGSAFADTMTGSANADIIYGGVGDDTILGGAGDDYLFGGDGNDTINAEAGDDHLDGGAGNDTLNGGIDNDVYVVTRSSGADTINNYDPSGTDIDVIGFNDISGSIADQDLWFERIGNNLKITVIGTGSSVSVTNWYVVTDAASRANHKIDFIIANTSYSRTINIESLVTLMASKAMPTTIAQRDTLMADLVYKANWATYWNTNAAPVLTAIAQQTTNEDTAKLLSVTATDDITPNTLVELRAQVISGTNVVTDAGITFGAANGSGVRTMTINPLANASGTARIRVTAIDAGGVPSTQEFDIVVAGVADTPTITQFSSAGGTSGKPIGIPLNIAGSFPDGDGSEVQEVWITGVSAGVTLSAGTYDTASATWKLTLAQLAGLKVMAPAGWSNDLTLTATGRATENGQTAISAAVQVTVSINAAPTNAVFSGSANENAVNGTAVGSVVGVDPDGDVLTYSAVDTAGGRFAVAANGAVSIGNAALIDFETATSHTITVRITDPRGEYIDRAFAITVNNVNEANSLPAGYAFGINENVAVGTAVGTVAASDLDSAAGAFGQQRYYFWNGSTATSTSSDGRYAINATTGLITVNSALNYEAGSPSAAYSVIARDNAGSAGYFQAQTTVTIGINNLNEQNSLPASYSFGVAELQGLGVGVGTIAATDLDVGGAFADQRYYFWDGTNVSSLTWDGRYQINAVTGVITTNQVLDYEGVSPSRAYTVLARDNAGSAGYSQSSTSVTIGVSNVNERPYNLILEAANLFSETVGADEPHSLKLLARFTLADPDVTVPGLVILSGNQNGWFQVNGNHIQISSGVNWTADWLRAYKGQFGVDAGFYYDTDGDGLKEMRVATLTLAAQDANGWQSDPFTYNVYIEDKNEAPNAPDNGATRWTFLDETGLGSNPANNYVSAGSFSLSDPDGTTPLLRFSDGSTSQGWFYIDGNTVRVNPGYTFDFETLRAQGYGIYDWNGDGRLDAHIANVWVRAFDGSIWSNDELLQVFISNVNEAPNTPDNGATRWSFLDETGFGGNPANPYSTVAAFSLSDPDGTTPQLRFTDGSTSQGWFYIDGNTVRINPGLTFDFEWLRANGYGINDWNGDGRLDAHVANVWVQAFDGSAWSNGELLQVFISDVNEPHSLINASGSFAEASGLPPLATVFDLRASMLQDPEGNNMTWTFADGSTQSGIWTITPDGKLTLTAGGVDYEALTTYYTDIWIDDGWGGYWYSIPTRDYSLATQTLAVRASDGQHSVTANFTATITDVNEGPSLGWSPRYIVRDDQSDGYLGTLYGYDPETGAMASTYSISVRSATESFLQPGSSSDVDNTGNPTVWANYWTGQLYFDTPSDGEWEGGIRYHPTLGGRWYYQLDYIVDVTMTDASGVARTESFTITFLKHDTAVVLPILLDLDGDGLELVDFETSTVTFDMDLDGTVDRTGWVGADDGMLVLDRNGNGIIDDMLEISFARDDENAVTDLEGLRAWDSNRDGVFNAQDAEFARFQIWRDANQNGVSEAGELFSLPAMGVEAINLTLNPTGAELVSDTNVIFATSDFRKSDGTSGAVGDVSFAYDPSKVDPNETPLAAPVIFDLDGDGAGLVELADSATRFDMNGDGIADKTGWIEQGDAFLALDRNGNGTIDGIGEISFVGDKPGAKTDLEGLAAFDGNSDGILDGDDERFVEFRLWRDGNADGKTDAGELLSLAEAGIVSISLTGTTTGDEQVAGKNLIYNTGSYTLVGEAQGSLLDVGLAYKALAALPEIPFQASTWEGKAKGWRLTAGSGAVRVVPRSANGVLSSDAGQLAGAAMLTFGNQTVGMLSSILLDLDGDGLEARQAKKSQAMFDMDTDGSADDTGWMSGGDGMLVIDRDGDGFITHASEISFLSEKDGAKNAWEGLSELDNTKDGKIDKSDARFGELKVWVDANGDGISQEGELKTLADLGITEIGLRNTALSDTVKVGQNLALSTATFKRENGMTATIGNVALGFTPSPVATLTADTSAGDGSVLDMAAFRNAGKLAEAMSTFGTDASQGTLSSLDASGIAAQDWFAAAAV
jgi:Ca2+-binding RTX toxin-like protein